MAKISEKDLHTDPLTSEDVVVVQIGGQTKRAPARKLPRNVGANYTLVLDDADRRIRSLDPEDSAAQCIVNIPLNADAALPIGTDIPIECKGTGGLAIVAADGITLNPGEGTLYILSQFSVAVLSKVDEDEWTCAGAVAL